VSGDILTVLWKEFKEVLLQRGGWRSGWMNVLVSVGVFGILLPLQAGRDWVENPLLMLVWMWVPLFLVTSVIADSFAGERERHTLETLLASRLSDRAILLGKVLASVLYGWGITMAMLLMGLVTVNVAHWGRGLLLYPPLVLAGAVVMILLVSALIACLGVIVSLRAATVRQAVQVMSLATMALFLVPTFGLQALPRSTQLAIANVARDLDLQSALVLVGTIILVLDAALLSWALARFRRARLILD
jgi:ABC-2 type transport system permease protein